MSELGDLTLSLRVNAQTMFAYVAYGELTKRTPASGDLNGLATLYDGAQASGQQDASFSSESAGISQ